MTNELQRALARCETARARYRTTVLASIGTAGRGDAIRAAIRECQAARVALRQVTSPPLTLSVS
jgi:hypothetical protein